MGFKRFGLLVAVRTVLMTCTLLLFVRLIILEGYPTLLVLLSALALAQLIELVRFVSKTNAELVRFLDSARYVDFSQRFQLSNQGAGFDELSRVLGEIMERFRDSRQSQEQELRRLKALIEHVPVPLISLKPDGELELHNNASRRLFGHARSNQLQDLEQFGQEFPKRLVEIQAGERHLVNFVVDDIERNLAVAATKISLGDQSEKVLSLQDIQSELDSIQMQSWQELVRVLTHEIMNSITPVASLAKTTGDLVNDSIANVDARQDLANLAELREELVDIKSAVDTVSRRSDGLMAFVQSYRRLTHLPVPGKSPCRLDAVFADVSQLVSAQWQDKAIHLACEVEPQTLSVQADRDLIEQVLINLLRNAEQALEGRPDASVRLGARLNRRGQVLIEVQDNGPGISEELATKVFVPFFTTKREGSGVGLALTRQVMIAHGGSVSLVRPQVGGVLIKLSF